MPNQWKQVVSSQCLCRHLPPALLQLLLLEGFQLSLPRSFTTLTHPVSFGIFVNDFCCNFSCCFLHSWGPFSNFSQHFCKCAFKNPHFSLETDTWYFYESQGLYKIITHPTPPWQLSTTQKLSVIFKPHGPLHVARGWALVSPWISTAGVTFGQITMPKAEQIINWTLRRS